MLESNWIYLNDLVETYEVDIHDGKNSLKPKPIETYST